MGKCPSCGEWNTFIQQKEEREQSFSSEPFSLTPLSKIKPLERKYKPTGISEFDRVLGGGIVPGEVILLTGEPGIGKSTLLLQSLAKLKTIYISGEEAAEQVKDRAERLKIPLKDFSFSDSLQIESIISGLESYKENTDVLVIDSVQTIYTKSIASPAGSVSQLKETTNMLTTYAKRNKIAVILVGHVTKEGDVAGPKTLEHVVDCVLSFEGERVSYHRVLRASKNRFGSTDEIGIFEMKETGLSEVTNPLAFLEDETESVVGKSIVGVAEGKRALFFEIQTLAVPTILSVPRRVVKGVDYNKVQLLLAVIRKHLGITLDTYDIYVNVVGGVQIKSTGADLGVVASLISSVRNIPIPKKTVFTGEVGLLGEVRSVLFEDKIIKEAKRLSFTRNYSSKSMKNIKELRKILV